MTDAAVLALGVDSAGVARGAQEVVRSLVQIKAAAAETAKAMADAGIKVGQGGTAMGGAASGADKMHRAMNQASNEIRSNARELSAWKGAMEAGEGAAEQFNRVIERAKELVVALGVAFAGLSMGKFVEETANAAARYQTLGVVLDRVGQNTTYSQAQINKMTQGVASMGITLTESRSALIQMIEAQIDLSKATALARAAQDAAVVANVNSSEAFQMLVHVIASGNSEMLRTLGLHTNFETAYQREAAALGKTVQSLTNQEQTQARLNAVMRATVEISGAYEAAMGTAGKQLTSMKRYAEDLQVRLGQIFLPAYTSLIMQTSDALRDFNQYLQGAPAQSVIEKMADQLRGLAENIVSIGEMALVAIGGRLVVALTTAIASGRALALVMGALGGPIGAVLTIATAGITYLATWRSAADIALDHVNARTKALADARRDAADATDQQTEAEKRLAEQRAQQQRSEAVKSAQAELKQNKTDLAALTAKEVQGAGDYATKNVLSPMWGGTQLYDQFSPAQQAATKRMQAEAMEVREGKRSLDEFIAEIRKYDQVMGDADGEHKRRQAILDVAAATKDAETAVEAHTDALRRLSLAQQVAGKGLMPDIQGDAVKLTNLLKGGGVSFDAQSLQLVNDNQKKADAIKVAYDGLVKDLETARDRWRDLANDQSKSADERKSAGDQVLSLENQITAALAQQQAIVGITNAMREGALQRELATMQRDNANLKRFGEAKGGRINALAGASDKLHQNREFLAMPADQQGKFEADYMAAEGQKYDLSHAHRGAAGTNSTKAAQVEAQWAERVAEAAGQGAYYQRQVRQEMERAVGLAQGGFHAAEATAKARAQEAQAIGQANALLIERERKAADTTGLANAMTGGLGQYRQAQAEQERKRVLRDVGPGQTGLADRSAASLLRDQAAGRADTAAQQVEQDRQSLALVQAEYTLRGQSKAMRDIALQTTRIDLEEQRALVGATGEQADAIRRAYDEQRRLTAEMEPYKRAIAEADEARQRSQQLAQALVQSIDNAVFSAKSLKDAFAGVLQTLEKMVAQALIFGPLQKRLESWMGDSGGILGGLFGGGAAAGGATSAIADSTALVSGGLYAKGDAFDHAIRDLSGLHSFSNSIVSSPTLFKFASGGGLMGEAGPEAVMPLTRGTDGRLGVTLHGDTGGSQVTVNAPITVNGGVGQNGQMDPAALANLQTQLARAVDMAVRQRIAQEQRPGGDLYR